MWISSCRCLWNCQPVSSSSRHCATEQQAASVANANMPAKLPVDKIVIFWKAEKQKWNTKSHPLPTVQYSSLISSLDFILNWPHLCSIHSILVHSACLCCCTCTTILHHLPEKSCFQPLFNAWKCFNSGTSTFNVVMIVKTYLVNISLPFVLFLNHTNICTTVLFGPLCVEDACCLWACMDSLHIPPTVQRRFHGVNCL